MNSSSSYQEMSSVTRVHGRNGFAVFPHELTAVSVVFTSLSNWQIVQPFFPSDLKNDQKDRAAATLLNSQIRPPGRMFGTPGLQGLGKPCKFPHCGICLLLLKKITDVCMFVKYVDMIKYSIKTV